MQITLQDSVIEVQPMPGNQGKLIVAQDKQGNVIVIPLPPGACKEIGMKLTTTLIIAPGPLSKSNGSH